MEKQDNTFDSMQKNASAISANNENSINKTEQRRPILILAGLSGVGKTSVMDAILSMDKRFAPARSATTRAPRGDGRDSEYIYMSDDEFSAAEAGGEFAESTTFLGKRYGTLHSELRRIYDSGHIPILVLEMNGVESFGMSDIYARCAVYIYTDLRTAADRLLARYGREPNGAVSHKCVVRWEKNAGTVLDQGFYAHMFYAAEENASTVEDCATRVIADLDRFVGGEASEPQRVSSVFTSLFVEGLRELEYPIKYK